MNMEATTHTSNVPDCPVCEPLLKAARAASEYRSSTVILGGPVSAAETRRYGRYSTPTAIAARRAARAASDALIAAKREHVEVNR